MSILGWIWWTSGKKQIREITSLDLKAWLTLVFCTLLGWGILYALLTIVFPALVAGYTASDVALWDAFVSATAWAGMWLLSRRKLDNWILLNLSNAVAVPLLIYKKMPFTAALTVFLFLVAVKGYYEWKKLMHPQPLPENVNSE
jgi:nicotinamide mononucleotide transporter